MKKQINKCSVYVFVSFVVLFLSGSVSVAAGSSLEHLSSERAAMIQKINLLQERVQQNVDLLRRQNREYLLFQGSINFAEDEENLSHFQKRLKEVEGQIILLSRQNSLPDPVWASQIKRETTYTGAPSFSFYHPLAAAPSSGGGTLLLLGIVSLLLLWGGMTLAFLYGNIRKRFSEERGLLYPCLLIQRGKHTLEPLYIPLS